MRVLLALALLLWASSDAHHSSKHNLKSPIFVPSRTHRYDLTVNMTSGIPGLTSQLAKSVFSAVVNIRPKTDTEYLLKIENVKVSNPQASVPHDDEYISLRRAPQLESDLSKPIRFTLRDGEITSYTVDPSESIESRRIKRSILRHLEFRVEERTEEVRHYPGAEYPYTYNYTKETCKGNLTSMYTVNVIPYADFPYEQNVFNISRTDVYDPLSYPSHHEHHNFAKQGCPEVCRVHQDNTTNKYGAGCTAGDEPHQTTQKMYYTSHYNLRLLQSRSVLDSMLITEKHIASMYDQDMVITITAEYQLRDVTDNAIEEPRETELRNDVDIDSEPEYETELNVPEEMRHVADIFPDLSGSVAGEIASRNLDELVETVVRAELERHESQKVGERIIILQRLLTLAKKEDLIRLWRNIVDVSRYRDASEKEKVKRQVLLEVMPLVGTVESVEFIKDLIVEKKVSVWEAKELLESIPENLMRPNEKSIKYIYELLELVHVKSQPLLHSAAHLTISRLIQKVCVASKFRNSSIDDDDDEEDTHLLRHFSYPFQRTFHSDDEDDEKERSFSRLFKSDRSSSRSSHFSECASPECPKNFVNTFIREISEKLRRTPEMSEKVIYIETLAHIGSHSVLPILEPYIYGTAEELESFDDGDVDFLKTVTLYSLHNIAGYYPSEMLDYVAPIYFNLTEVPRVRIAAFSVLIKSQPPMALLQHIAVDSWQETSNEVGSFVYSAVQTLGNSSEPCFQLTAERIRYVISQFKVYDIGHQHAKAVLHSFFDKIRNFGAEYYRSYVPSNETYVPNSVYHSVTYGIDSLRDDLLKLAMNIQGLTVEDILKYLDPEFLRELWPKDIPHGNLERIFGSLKLLPRLPKELRVTIYKKLFYVPTYMYIDMNTIGKIFQPLEEHVRNIFKVNRGEIMGHGIKVFIPSSYHSSSVGRTFPYRIEFNMKHPLLLSLKTKTTKYPGGTPLSIDFKLRPSIYYTTYLSKHIVNTNDKIATGVYFEQKYIWSSPIEGYLHYNYHNNTLVGRYHLPELPKRFFRYHSEAGTYASEMKLESLPSCDNREPIKTIPTLFHRENPIEIGNLPILHLVTESENIAEAIEDTPRDLYEAFAVTMRYLRNAGWRRKDINATLVKDSNHAIDTVFFTMSYNKTDEYDVRKVRSSNEWFSSQPSSQYEEEEMQEKNMQFMQERSNRADEPWLTKQDAEKIYKKIAYQLPHVFHEFEVKIETLPILNKVQLRVEYNHTHDKIHHFASTDVKIKTPDRRSVQEYCLSHAMRYWNVPNEFKYDQRKYGSQSARFYTTVDFDECKSHGQSDITIKGSLSHVPYEKLFDKNEFSDSLRKEWFLPETHEECVQDVRMGKPLSVACMRAVREESIYNKYRIRTEWTKDLPEWLLNVTYRVDEAMKYAFYSHADINRINIKNPSSTLDVTVEYINKLVDEPVANIYIESPRETVHYRKVDAEPLKPLSGLYKIDEVIMNHITNNTYPPSCAVTEKYVRTFDLKTYELPEDQCSYVVSTHCVERKKFAVLAKHVSSSQKEIQIYIEKHIATLKPPSRDGTYNLVFDGKEYTVKENRPVLLDDTAMIHAYVIPLVNERDTEYILSFHADKVGVYVKYDGKNLKLEVNPLYKGQVCGLCSEFDGEITREYRGINQCLYSDSLDFAHSSIVNAEECGVSRNARNPALCPSGSEGSSSWSDRSKPSYAKHDDDDDEDDSYDSSKSMSRTSQPMPRTIHMQRGEHVCFSTKPVKMCDEESSPEDTQRKSVDFHCLPKYDATTRKLIVESQSRILHELSRKSVDFSDTISVPRKCSM